MWILSLCTILLVADPPMPDPAKVRECSAWCVSSYKGAWSESLSCIDSCQRNYPNHPTARCAKQCVVKAPDDAPTIGACIDRCGR